LRIKGGDAGDPLPEFPQVAGHFLLLWAIEDLNL